MKHRRKLLFFGACIFLALLLLFLARNSGEDYPAGQGAMARVRPEAREKAKLEVGASATSSDPGEKSNGAKDEELRRGFLSTQQVIQDLPDPSSRGIRLNDDFLGGFDLTRKDKIRVWQVLGKAVDAVNSKASAIVTDTGRRSGPEVGGNAKIYRIEGRNVNDADLKEALRKGFSEVVGDERGTILLNRILVAADKDPILRGFGTLPVEVTFKAVTESNMVYWDYRIFKSNGEVLSSGTRSHSGFPLGLRNLLTIGEE
ncbi:MAG TPA: hypothetical protein VG796_06735 [Verrucomicrobiales bacterium]|nr:hypothetical protein [Verrucomicrobiales bacterium]